MARWNWYAKRDAVTEEEEILAGEVEADTAEAAVERLRTDGVEPDLHAFDEHTWDVWVYPMGEDD